MLGISVFASEDIFDRIDKNINKGETKIDESIDNTKTYISNKKDKVNETISNSKKKIESKKEALENDELINSTKNLLSK